MRVGWLHDGGNLDGTRGGAELTQDEFRAAAPKGVEVVDCPAGGVVEGLDAYVAHNVVFYSADDLRAADGPLFKYWHDVGPHIRPDVAEELNARARHICCSPLQRDYLGLKAELIPPPVDLERFRAARSQNGVVREGIVALGPWMNYAKNPGPVFEWAQGQLVDFYGSGPLAPQGARAVPYDHLPELLTRYETFVHLPLAIEPFGRGVVEAWAAGCRVITNKLVGARWWIEEQPTKLDTAADDFWKLVTTKRKAKQ